MIYIYKSNHPPFFQLAKVIAGEVNCNCLITDSFQKKGTWIVFPDIIFNKEICSEICKNSYILVQTENLKATQFYNIPEYHELIRNAQEVWDYTSNFKLGFSQVYQIEYEDSKPIDILFYGCMNERREKILSKISNITILDSKDQNSWYPKIWNKIRNSKIVLSVHYYEPSNNDFHRVASLLANKTFVIAEKSSLDEEYNKNEGFLTFKYDEIPDACQYYLNNTKERIKWQEKGYNYILKNPIKIPKSFYMNKSFKKYKVCEIVFSCNRIEYLKKTLENEKLINFDGLEVHKILIDDYPINRNDEEIKLLARTYGFNEIILHDENLGISKTWQEFFDLIKHRNFDYILHHEDDVELTEEVKISNLIDILESNPSLYQIQLKRNNWYPHETDTDFKKDSDVIINNYRLEKNDTYFWMLFSLYPAWISREPILKETGNNPAEGVLSHYLKTKYNLTGGILKKLNGDILVNHFGEYTKGKRVCKGEPGWEGFKDFIPEKKYCSRTGKAIE
jgi:hypothetical protein